MGRLLFAAVFSTLVTGAAFAADMPLKARPVEPVMSWTGFYINGGLGYGMWTADTTTVDPTTGACVLCVTQTQGGRGWFGTVGAGYDYQLTGSIVAGVFADVDLGEIKGTIQDQGPFFAGRIKENWAWAAGTRVGLLMNPETLTYLNGGYTQAHFGSAAMVHTTTDKLTDFSTPSFDKGGWFLGSGIETTFSPFGRGWFWRTEYRYSYFGSKLLPDRSPSGGVDNSITFKPLVQSVRTELVYKFNGGASAPGSANWVSAMASAGSVRWTGFYLNGGLGYGMWHADTTTVNPTTGTCVLCTNQTQGGRGWFGTVGAGYDTQLASRLVGGVFADVDLSSIKGTIQDAGPFFAGEIKETWSWAAGPRLGWLMTPDTLTYVNGGYTKTHFDGASMVNTHVGASTPFVTSDFDKSGWFVGGGVERSLAMFGLGGPGWFWRSEYRYASYGQRTLTDTVPSTGATMNSITFKPAVQTVRSEIVYKFNWPG